MKYWIQSFLLGVPKIIVGFRTPDGILVDIKEIETQQIPQTVNARPNAAWNADICVNFAAAFLECMVLTPPSLSLILNYNQGSCKSSTMKESGEYLAGPIRPSLRFTRRKKQDMAIS